MKNKKMLFYLILLNFVTPCLLSLVFNDTVLDEKMAEKNKKFAMGLEEVSFKFFK